MSNISIDKKNRKDKFKHYTIGIPELDSQHWELLELIAKIKRIIKRGCKRLVKKYIDKFFIKLNAHIAYEEALMKTKKFPYILNHIQQEQVMISKIKVVIHSDESILHTNTTEMETIIKDHIDNSDSQVLDSYNKWIKSVTNQ